jgi:ATP-dependent RNA helicase RhlB
LPAIEEKLGRKISCETPPTHLLRAVVRQPKSEPAVE